jgi:hypothetical protein
MKTRGEIEAAVGEEVVIIAFAETPQFRDAKKR